MKAPKASPLVCLSLILLLSGSFLLANAGKEKEKDNDKKKRMNVRIASLFPAPATGEEFSPYAYAVASGLSALFSFRDKMKVVDLHLTYENDEEWKAHLDRLVSSKYNVVIGFPSSGTLQRVKDYMITEGYTDKILVISVGSTAPTLAVEDNIIRWMPSDEQQVEALAFYAHSKSIKRVVPLCAQDLYAEDFVRVFNEQWPELGANLSVTLAVQYPKSVENWTSVLVALEASVKEAIQAEGGNPSNVAVLLKGFEEAGSLFEAADQTLYPSLNSVRWLGTDTTAQIEAIRGSDLAVAFARRTQFIATSPQVDESAVDTPPLLEALREILGRLPTTAETIGFDAAICAGMAQMFLHRDGNFTIDKLFQTLFWVSATQNLPGGRAIFNAVGDKVSSPYSLWKINEVTQDWVVETVYPFTALKRVPVEPKELAIEVRDEGNKKRQISDLICPAITVKPTGEVFTLDPTPLPGAKIVASLSYEGSLTPPNIGGGLINAIAGASCFAVLKVESEDSALLCESPSEVDRSCTFSADKIPTHKLRVKAAFKCLTQYYDSPEENVSKMTVKLSYASRDAQPVKVSTVDMNLNARSDSKQAAFPRTLSAISRMVVSWETGTVASPIVVHIDTRKEYQGDAEKKCTTSPCELFTGEASKDAFYVKIEPSEALINSSGSVTTGTTGDTGGGTTNSGGNTSGGMVTTSGQASSSTSRSIINTDLGTTTTTTVTNISSKSFTTVTTVNTLFKNPISSQGGAGQMQATQEMQSMEEDMEDMDGGMQAESGMKKRSLSDQVFVSARLPTFRSKRDAQQEQTGALTVKMELFECVLPTDLCSQNVGIDAIPELPSPRISSEYYANDHINEWNASPFATKMPAFPDKSNIPLARPPNAPDNSQGLLTIDKAIEVTSQFLVTDVVSDLNPLIGPTIELIKLFAGATEDPFQQTRDYVGKAIAQAKKDILKDITSISQANLKNAQQALLDAQSLSKALGAPRHEAVLKEFSNLFNIIKKNTDPREVAGYVGLASAQHMSMLRHQFVGATSIYEEVTPARRLLFSKDLCHAINNYNSIVTKILNEFIKDRLSKITFENNDSINFSPAIFTVNDSFEFGTEADSVKENRRTSGGSYAEYDGEIILAAHADEIYARLMVEHVGVVLSSVQNTYIYRQYSREESLKNRYASVLWRTRFGTQGSAMTTSTNWSDAELAKGKRMTKLEFSQESGRITYLQAWYAGQAGAVHPAGATKEGKDIKTIDIAEDECIFEARVGLGTNSWDIKVANLKRELSVDVVSSMQFYSTKENRSVGSIITDDARVVHVNFPPKIRPCLHYLSGSDHEECPEETFEMNTKFRKCKGPGVSQIGLHWQVHVPY